MVSSPTSPRPSRIRREPHVRRPCLGDRAPLGLRLLLALLAGAAALLAALAAAPASLAQSDREPDEELPSFGEIIEVHRTIVDLRVIDGGWRPVEGLGPEDFEVVVDGRPVQVEAVEWSPADGEGRAGSGSRSTGGGGEEPRGSEAGTAVDLEAALAPPARRQTHPPGRLIVLFVQGADFYLETFGEGHMRLLPRVQGWLEELPPDDRVAVLRYGGSLELVCDFTTDRERLRACAGHAVFGRPEPGRGRREEPSLAAFFDPDRARRAATVERALAVTGEALAKIPGPKTMLFAGWGLGVNGSTRDWSDARVWLGTSRTSVFVLDIVTADFHTLGASLEHIAAITGGLYTTTYPYAQDAVNRLDRTLGGHYTLVLVTERLARGGHDLEVRLSSPARRAGRVVLAPDALFID